MNLFEENETDFMNGPHFIPQHKDITPEEQHKLDEMRKRYLSRKLNKSIEKIKLPVK